jgi:hypothetical protein
MTLDLSYPGGSFFCPCLWAPSSFLLGQTRRKKGLGHWELSRVKVRGQVQARSCEGNLFCYLVSHFQIGKGSDAGSKLL